MPNVIGTVEAAKKAKTITEQIHDSIFGDNEPGTSTVRASRRMTFGGRHHQTRASAPNDGRWHMKHHRGRR